MNGYNELSIMAIFVLPHELESDNKLPPNDNNHHSFFKLKKKFLFNRNIDDFNQYLASRLTFNPTILVGKIPIIWVWICTIRHHEFQ